MIDICCFEQTLEYTEQGKTVHDVGLVKKNNSMIDRCCFEQTLEYTEQGKTVHNVGLVKKPNSLCLFVCICRHFGVHGRAG